MTKPRARALHSFEPSEPCPSRRRAIFLGGGALAAAALGPRFGADSARARQAQADPRSLDALASALIEAKPSAAPELFVEAIAAGVDRVTLFGAVLLAGVRAMHPRVVGNEFHSVLMIESALRLTDGAGRRETWLALLWTVDDYLSSVRNARRRGTHPLDRAPAPLARGAARNARAELARAMDAFDPEAADRAALTLARQGQALAVFDVLRPYSARSFTNAGHRVLYAAQAERAVRRIGAEHAEPVVRSLAIALANDERGPQTESFEAAQELAAAELVEPKVLAKHAEESVSVLAAVRGKQRAESQHAVWDALDAGLDPARIWDGLRLYSAELLMNRPAPERAFPVHTTTELESLGAVAERAEDDATKKLLLLQAAGWLVEAREAIVGNNGAYGEDSILGLGADVATDTPDDLSAAFCSRSMSRVRHSIETSKASTHDIAQQLLTGLIRGAHQNHQFKLAAAMLEESARAHPEWRSILLAAGVDYVPPPNVPESEVSARSARRLQDAGLI